MIPKFIDLCQGYREEIQKIALGIDLRSGYFFQYWPDVLAEIREADHHLKVLFFDSSDEILLRRFSETRRPHPLAGSGSVPEGITRERKALEGMRALADMVIDTSDLNVHELKSPVTTTISRKNEFLGRTLPLHIHRLRSKGKS